MSGDTPLISIALDGSDRVTAGTTLHGYIRFEFEQRCSSLTVCARWSVSGTGDPEFKETAVVELLDRAGLVPVVRRFSLPLPPEPWTYHGRILKITWEVIALCTTGDGRLHSEPATIHEARLPFVLLAPPPNASSGPWR